MSPKSAYDHTVSRAVERSDDEELLRLTELEALIKLRLREPLDEATFHRLAETQLTMRRAQQGLVSQLDSGMISPEQYLARLTTVLEAFRDDAAKVSGSRRFITIFGPESLEPDGLVDHETFLAMRHS